MSLAEAAAALDKLLRGPPRPQAFCASPSFPSLPLSLQPQESPQGPTCSTPLEASQVSALLPWNTLGYPVQDVSLPISPLQLPASPLDQSFSLPALPDRPLSLPALSDRSLSLPDRPLSLPALPALSDRPLSLSDRPLSLSDRLLSTPPAYPSKSCFPRPPLPPSLPQPSERWLALAKRSRTTSCSSTSSSRQNQRRAGAEDHRRKSRGGGRLGGPREEFVPLDPDKYKTELCRSYQLYGICKYGARCVRVIDRPIDLHVRFTNAVFRLEFVEPVYGFIYMARCNIFGCWPSS
ncbi:CREB-regulated transcription coactivator 2-like [Penaeus vannamei]|uniref:CREB-regulated transcription coactivator 2-like n=1 Tax=Penaeus vannamei TaxID=6689 RepID=UPI00387F4E13